jgi:hypothetical protein
MSANGPYGRVQPLAENAGCRHRSFTEGEFESSIFLEKQLTF